MDKLKNELLMTCILDLSGTITDAEHTRMRAEHALAKIGRVIVDEDGYKGMQEILETLNDMNPYAVSKGGYDYDENRLCEAVWNRAPEDAGDQL